MVFPPVYTEHPNPSVVGFKQINIEEQSFYINFFQLFLSGAKTTPGYRATFGCVGMCNNR